MHPTVRHLSLVVAAAVIVFFTNLGGPRLWDRDEPRNAGCAAEMLERGDWVVPVFNAELRTHKPVLLYWLMMTAYQVFGVNEFAARFWSAGLAVGTVVCTYLIGRRLFDATAALWSALILCSTIMFTVTAPAATPDSVLIFFCTLATLVYVYATFNRVAGRDATDVDQVDGGSYFPSSWPAVALMYAILGVAMLAKGPIGLVLPTAVIGMFLLIMRLPADTLPSDGTRWGRVVHGVRTLLRPFAPWHFLKTCWQMRPITALGMALAVALPWYLWVGLRTNGAWLQGFLLDHNVNRALQPLEGHDGSLFYYPGAVLVGFFPWSVLAVPVVLFVVARVRRRGPWTAGMIFVSCWVCVYLGIFSLARTKLPSYVTPAYPALALITGCLVTQWTRRRHPIHRWWLRLAMGSLVAVGAAMLVAVPLAARRYLPGDEWLGATGLVPLVGGVACWALIEWQRLRGAAAALAGTSFVLVILLFGLVAVRVDRHQENDRLLHAIAACSNNPQIASVGCLEPSWVFYAGRPIVECRADQAAAFVRRSGDRFVITKQQDYEELKSMLPPDTAVLARARYFMKKDTLLLIGRRASAPAMTSSTDRHASGLR